MYGGQNMIRKAYSAGTVKHSFWFAEFRKEVELLSEGKSFDEIRLLNKNENIFSAPTKARATQIYNIVTARVRSLDKSFYPVFLQGDLSTQKLFTLTAVMANDTCFFDFVYTVIREKLMIGSNEYTDADVRIFFHNIRSQNEIAEKWTDETVAKLGRTYKTMLFESGMTDKGKDVRKIHRPIMERELKNWLTSHEMSIVIETLTGGR